jgi:sugar phosphate isomerase/epimerase
VTYYLGLAGRGTPRANPDGKGLEGFIALAQELGARTIELWEPWLADHSDDALRALAKRLRGLGMEPVVSSGIIDTSIDGAIRAARALDAKIIRMALTRVLCGDRAAQGAAWGELMAAIRNSLKKAAPIAAANKVTIAIENHQDFGSDELVAFCEQSGGAIGICFDTGNTFPVAEAPLDFTRRIAPHVRHVHLKDYRVQLTDEGYRLVRCAIGDGCVPFKEMVAILGEHHRSLPAVLEPGALEARHVRLFTASWWTGYAPMTAQALAACLAATRPNHLEEHADYRTPWERGEDGSALIAFELDQIRRSAANMKAIGLMG